MLRKCVAHARVAARINRAALHADAAADRLDDEQHGHRDGEECQEVDHPTMVAAGCSWTGRTEPPVRFELTTYRLQGGCSTTELQGRTRKVYAEAPAPFSARDGDDWPSRCVAPAIRAGTAVIQVNGYRSPAKRAYSTVMMNTPL